MNICEGCIKQDVCRFKDDVEKFEKDKFKLPEPLIPIAACRFKEERHYTPPAYVPYPIYPTWPDYPWYWPQRYEVTCGDITCGTTADCNGITAVSVSDYIASN